MAEGQTQTGGANAKRSHFRPTAEERRAARVAAVAGRQGELKAQAAERRAKRAQQERAAGAAAPESRR